MKTFLVSNFGCRSSQAEGAAIEEQVKAEGFYPAKSESEAQVVVVNSCTVTAEADRQVRQTIRRIHRSNPNAKIIVTGCYAQRTPEELRPLDGVRYVVGNSHKSVVPDLTVNLLRSESQSEDPAEVICSTIFDSRELRPSPYFGSGGRTRAIVKVQDGCNANCSFCIIPSVRGRSRSLSPELVVAEVAGLTARGFREVVFSGIHLGSYGRDLHLRSSLIDLALRTLADVPGLEMLRLSSIEPLEVVPELIDLVAEHPRLAHHLHIPLQSGSSRILRAMRRPYTPTYYVDLLRRIRSRLPDASIGADVMVGFPGETDREFLETLELVRESELTYLHVFPYSARPGTPSATMPNPVPVHVAAQRARLLRRTIAEKNAAFREGFVGKALEVLVLGEQDNGDGEGRPALSRNFLRVRVSTRMTENAWVRVPIVSCGAEELIAADR